MHPLISPSCQLCCSTSRISLSFQFRLYITILTGCAIHCLYLSCSFSCKSWLCNPFAELKPSHKKAKFISTSNNAQSQNFPIEVNTMVMMIESGDVWLNFPKLEFYERVHLISADTGRIIWLYGNYVKLRRNIGRMWIKVMIMMMMAVQNIPLLLYIYIYKLSVTPGSRSTRRASSCVYPVL